MKKSFMQLKLIPPIVAFLISTFLIFPDVVLLIEEGNEDAVFLNDRPREERGKPPRYLHEEEFHRQPPKPVNELGSSDNRKGMPEPRRKEFNGLILFVEFCFFFFISFFSFYLNLYCIQKIRPRLHKKVFFYWGLLFLNLLLGTFWALLHQMMVREFLLWPLNGLVLFKCYFVSLNTYLMVYLFTLIVKHERTIVENERLKTQNLEVKCASLVTQLNPHFFFNSMNSLAFLIREKETEKSLKYVHKLSELFRYMLSSGKQNLATVKQEIDMLTSFIYLMNIRYEDKLRFEFRVEEKYMDYRLPVLTLQPLVENAIKHNSATDDFPLSLLIRIVDDGRYMEVSNPIQAKFIVAESNGIGLKNLNQRCMLLFNTPIIVSEQGGVFSVKVPLTQ